MSTTEQSVSERSTVHSTFVVERTYAASPERVSAAWADPAAKTQWFGPSEKHAESYSSVSVTTVEREHGTNAMLDTLGTYVHQSLATEKLK